MKKRNNKKGQVTFEMALLIVVMIGMTKLLQEAPFMKTIFEDFLIGPWQRVRVMMESGVWKPDQADGKLLHPSQRERLYSSEGQKP